jgi:hypothetical protein
MLGLVGICFLAELMEFPEWQKGLNLATGSGFQHSFVDVRGACFS